MGRASPQVNLGCATLAYLQTRHARGVPRFGNNLPLGMAIPKFSTTTQSHKGRLPMPLVHKTHDADPVRIETDIHGILTLRLSGELTGEVLRDAAERLVAAGQGRRVTGVLIETIDTSIAYEIADVVSAIEMIMDELSPRRCAHVSHGERTRPYMVMESTARAFAVKLQPFACETEARAWLLQR